MGGRINKDARRKRRHRTSRTHPPQGFSRIINPGATGNGEHCTGCSGAPSIHGGGRNIT